MIYSQAQQEQKKQQEDLARTNQFGWAGPKAGAEELPSLMNSSSRSGIDGVRASMGAFATSPSVRAMEQQRALVQKQQRPYGDMLIGR